MTTDPKAYYRPLAQTGPARPPEALPLAGGWAWFERVERLSRGAAPEILPASETPPEILARLTAPRAPIAGLTLERPRIMGILNVTPDSFSDGGRFSGPDQAVAAAREMIAQGCDILDIGGESTRPGAEPVPVGEEIARVIPVLKALRGAGIGLPVSLDTRKARVAAEGIWAGADMINDVSALTHDRDMADTVYNTHLALCLMHAQGEPRTMQHDPRYDDVLLDVYDYLEARAAAAEAGGVERARLVLDPGIGFGKTLAHNLALLARIGLFHALGCALLLGVSRKGFIGRLGGTGAAEPARRLPGSLAVALAAIGQGVQIVRVHDIAETRQAVTLFMAATKGEADI